MQILATANTKLLPNTLNPRQRALLSLARMQAGISVVQLADQLQANLVTIRRDIQRLAAQGYLTRFHGGVRVPCSSAEKMDCILSDSFNTQCNRQIARKIADFIPNSCSLILNVGTTTEAIARALMQHTGLHVITNSLNIASILSGNPQCEVIVVNGIVRSHDQGIVGEEAADFIRQFRVDLAIMSISGIGSNGTLCDSDSRQVKVTQAIIHHAQEVWLAADSSKFGRSEMFEVASLSQIDCLFTNTTPPEPFVALLAEANVHLQLAGVP
jgi:DeoR family transcriptional regulator, glycerol-3-phosphate regulon repressor